MNSSNLDPELRQLPVRCDRNAGFRHTASAPMVFRGPTVADSGIYFGRYVCELCQAVKVFGRDSVSGRPKCVATNYPNSAEPKPTTDKNNRTNKWTAWIKPVVIVIRSWFETDS